MSLRIGIDAVKLSPLANWKVEKRTMAWPEKRENYVRIHGYCDRIGKQGNATLGEQRLRPCSVGWVPLSLEGLDYPTRGVILSHIGETRYRPPWDINRRVAPWPVAHWPVYSALASSER